MANRKHEPHIMTFEEIRQFNYEDTVYVEYRLTDKVIGGIVLQMYKYKDTDEIKRIDIGHGVNRIACLPMKDYNIDFRFWIIKPTDEQREKTKWN